MERLNIKEYKKSALLGAITGAVAGGVVTTSVEVVFGAIGVQLVFWPVLDWWISGKDTE